MKSLPAALILIAVIVAGSWVLLSGQLPGILGQPVPDSSLDAPDETTSMTVAHVHDGDTLFLSATDGTEQKVRLIGVDTPELQPAEDCYAVAARDYLRQLAPDGSTVTVAADTEAQDQYGRSLYYLWSADGVFVNLKLVAEGYGTALRIEPNSAHWDELLAAEDAARNASAGMWGQC